MATLLQDQNQPVLAAGGIIVIALSVVAYTAICRVWFHPLSRIPGPRLAAATYLYEIYFNIVKPGMFVWEIKRLHELYGPIIRVNPREVHINDIHFLDIIYSTSQPRDKDMGNTLDMTKSLGGAYHHELHKVRRAALTPFFSKPAVTRMESMVSRKVDRLQNLLAEHQRNQLPINLSDVYLAYSQDIAKWYGFGWDEDLLSDTQRAAAARANLNSFMIRCHINSHFGWTNLPLRYLPQSVIKRIAPGLVEMTEFRKKIATQIARILSNAHDSAETTEKREQDTVFAELRDTKILPEEEKSPGRLLEEGLLMVAAGSEAPSKTLWIIHYHLLANPRIMGKLRSELRNAPAAASWSDLEQLPYLRSVVEEGNRLNFGLTLRNKRRAPSTLKFGAYEIPPMTPMSMSSLFANTHPDLYHDPWDFRPERWLEPGASECRKYLMSWGKGTRRCIGVNLAQMEIFLAVAAIAKYDMDLYETDMSDVEFRHDYMTFQPRLGSKGVRAKVLRCTDS